MRTAEHRDAYISSRRAVGRRSSARSLAALYAPLGESIGAGRRSNAPGWRLGAACLRPANGRRGMSGRDRVFALPAESTANVGRVVTSNSAHPGLHLATSDSKPLPLEDTTPAPGPGVVVLRRYEDETVVGS
jgi:hypothetical protein